MTTDVFSIEPSSLDQSHEALRREVREFLAREMPGRPLQEAAKSWQASDHAFSRKVGQRGWIGMTWPKIYGGHERTALERYVVVEELLAASAPVGAHMVGDRQTGPSILRFGSEEMKSRILPGLARGEVFCCAGLSEPGTGSDLASLRTRATRSGNGWVINGTKVWTSLAHSSHYMVTLVRTSPPGDNRHAGLTQFLLDLRSPGITLRPIPSMAGDHEFNEVSLVDVPATDADIIGQEGDGWKQATAELAFERSGPERYLTATRLLREMLDRAPQSSERHAVAIGRVVASYAALRQMSLGIANMLARGENPELAAALVKDLGTAVEQNMAELAHDLFDASAAPLGSPLEELTRHATMLAPGYTIKGGTREVLRGIIARGLGLR